MAKMRQGQLFKMKRLEKSIRSDFELDIAASLDVRKRIDKGMRRLTMLQYAVYLICSSVMLGFVAYYYWLIERHEECWVADTLDEHRYSLFRKRHAWRFRWCLIALFIYFFIDTVRLICLQIYCLGGKYFG